MKILTVIWLIITLCACSATITETKRSDYERHAPEIMAFVAKESGKPEAPIPQLRISDEMEEWGAFYDAKNNTIILRHDWTPDIEGLGAVAHEFTHAIQHRNDPDTYRRQVAWVDALKRGETKDALTWVKSILATCLDREHEAYRVDYAYQAHIDPDYVRKFLMGVTVERAAELHAQGSCEPVQKWRDSLEGGTTYKLKPRN